MDRSKSTGKNHHQPAKDYHANKTQKIEQTHVKLVKGVLCEDKVDIPREDDDAGD